jgi:hypothetical protein
MRSCLFAVLVTIYLVLDFATPLMPGAVWWGDGSLQTDAGVFAHRSKNPAPVATPLPDDFSRVVPLRKRAFPTELVISASPPPPVLLLAAVRPRSILASSPDDD